MAGKTREQKLQDVHARAVERFDRCYSSQRDMRQQCVRDRRFVFVPGAQFEGDLEQQFANRPRFEINKLHQSVIRIFSEYRNNRVTVDFRPEDEDTSEDTADFLDGLYRADEQESGAQEAYDTAYEEGVAGGMGAWRLVNRYEDDEDEDSDRRRICFEPIPDADNSVFFDVDAKRYDKSDASYGFVVTGMQQDAHSEMSGEDSSAVITEWKAKRKAIAKGGVITSFDKVARVGVFDWFAPDTIYVAEYYEVEALTEPVNFYLSLASGEEEKLKPKSFENREEFEAKEKELVDQGFVLARVKKVKTRKVHKYLIDGARVLEDMGYVAGKHIPVVPYYAKRGFVDNIERISGQVRLATDLQRLYNMLASMLAEISVRSPVEKPIFYPEQIVGHEMTWAEDDIKRYPYTLINPMYDALGQIVPPTGLSTKAPQIPPALAGLITLIGMDLKEVLGSSENAQEVVSNISAKAVELIQNRLDMQNFIYMDNFKKSMKRCGEVYLGMARELYDEEDRPMRTVKLDGTDSIEKLRQKKVDPKTQAIEHLNDPSSGKFKVIADVGPSFTTRRDGTVRAVTGMMQFVEDPTDKAVLTGVAIQNLEGEGLQDIKAYWRKKMVMMGVTEPTDEEKAEMDAAKKDAKPDAQTQFLLAEAEKSLASAKKLEADALLSLQKITESEANAAQLLAKIDDTRMAQILQLIEGMEAQEQAGAQGQQAQPAAQPARGVVA